jgi:type IV fimbrial biogenesis protein FimT
MPNSQGFTLIEMMIAIVIGAILITVGIPGFFDMIQRNSVSATSNELVAALLYARSEAIRQEANVTFTPGVNGWIVQANLDDGDVTVLEHVIDNEKIAIAENISSGSTITYNSRGRAIVSAGDSYNISFDNATIAHVCINLTGRPYSKKAADGVCP